MSSIGPMEIVLILLVVLLVFGAKRIPEIARGLGKGIREFKDATNDIKREISISSPPPSAQIGHTPPSAQPYGQPYAAQPAPPAAAPYGQAYPPTPEQAPPPAHPQPGAPPPPPPPTEGQPPV